MMPKSISSILIARETDVLASDLTEEIKKEDPELEAANAALLENEIKENEEDEEDKDN